METGYRRDARGNKIPGHIIERFTCEYSGRVVFEVETDQGRVFVRKIVTIMAGYCLALLARAEPTSGFEFLSEANQRLQQDEFANPGYLWVERGTELFSRSPTNGNACSDCHTVKEMAGVALGYPQNDEERDALVDLTQQINWETPGSLHRLYRWCNEAVRAEPFERSRREALNT